jgi:energy-coupling factor transporter ATP-binding protein EcfA2
MMGNDYYINRIKLLNFHNFSNVTVELNQGGHLFLLGDNGSGKTTVLDAIHYVLTAGEQMEFNAAARVTGNKQQGRRAQGIITRYNVDTGHLRPSGGVTYAALEIMGDNGKITTAAIGMSVNSPDDSLTRWGIIKDCPLEDIPFLITDLEGERPRDKTEMKQILGGVGYFGQPHSFCNLLAERFLGGRAKFKDFCRFLSMGKAYREIAAHTTDYQKLFMRLLPESDQDIFEQIILSLKSIDESRSDLNSLAENLNYLRDLIGLKNDIESSNAQAVAFDAVELFIRITHLSKTINDDKNSIVEWQQQQAQAADELLELKEQYQSIEQQANELKSRDPSGALVKAQELQDKIATLNLRLQSDKAKLLKQQHAVSTGEGALNDLLTLLEQNLTNLMRKLPEKSIKTGIETGKIMTAIEQIIHHNDEPKKPLELIFSALLEQIRKELSQKQSNLAVVESRLATQQEQEAEIASEEQHLLKLREAMPELNSFQQLINDLDQNGIVYTPLYKGLEWHPDVDESAKSRIEEFIGEELLATIVINDAEYQAAAEIIFDDYPGHRLAISGLDNDIPQELREWATMIFDINASNPLLLTILLQELSAKQLPEFTLWQNTNIVKFRSHERSFCGYDARFIGAESRELEQKRKIKSIRAELKDIRLLVKTTIKTSKELKSSIRLLTNLNKLVEDSFTEFRQQIVQEGELTLKLSHAMETLNRLNDDYSKLTETLATSQTQLKLLNKLIEDNDLEAIENQLVALDAKMQQSRQALEQQLGIISKLKVREEDATLRIAELEQLLAEQQTIYHEKLFLLEKRYGRQNAQNWIENMRNEHRLHVELDAAKLADECRFTAREKLASLKIRINDIIGADYGFAYDQENYQLFSRGGLTATAIEASLAKNLAEQKSLINDQTIELFNKLIMDTMIRTLWEKVHGLEQMQREINRLLDGRSFGNNSYRIKIRPSERYASLVKLIKASAYFTPENEANVKAFFEDHKDELINTPPGVIPEILDYRNWYRYEMCVYSTATAASDDGAVMNSRVKSVGSGGEQAVPNYLLVLTIAHFMFSGSNIKLNTLLFDEAFYGIDSQRRDQLLGFASDLGLQLFVASPDQDGVKDEIAFSTSLLVVKDSDYEVHLFPYHWTKNIEKDMFEPEPEAQIAFTEEL